MECPQGMSDLEKDDCVMLSKCIYSLVQAVQQYNKKAVEILKEPGFVEAIYTYASILRRVRGA